MDISVIVPTFNRCRTLVETIGALALLDSPRDSFEVIIVDNGSADRTSEAVTKAQAEFPGLGLRYVFEGVPGLLAGRHRGVREARGEICSFVDDDILVAPDWLNALRQAFANPDVVLVGGPSRPLFEAPQPAWLQRFFSEDESGRRCSWLSLFDGGDRVRSIDPCDVWGLNYSIRRKALVDFGGFHPDLVPRRLQRFQGDGETGLSLKLKSAGIAGLYHPQAEVQHRVPASRLGVKYFRQRAYYQGVCDSYTQIRAAGVAPEREGRLNEALGWLRETMRDLRRGDAVDLAGIREAVKLSHRAGFQFHQYQVGRNARLLEWVVKETYWDYELPMIHS